MQSSGKYVTINDIREAARVIDGFVTYCPLVYSPYFSGQTGENIFFKTENFQPTKVFKLRGAINKIKSLKNEKKVVTASSGNHGLSVAYASRVFGKRATIFVPKWANPDKIKTITSYGAEVVIGGESYEDAYADAIKYCEAENSEFVHPFEDPHVIAGQGTIGLEIYENMPEIDTVIVPVGGGGLVSGISVALKSLTKKARVIGVQSENNPAMVEAYHGRDTVISVKESIADGMITKKASDITLSIIKKNVDDMVTVSEEEIEKSLLALLVNDHILVEPSGAASAACLLQKNELLKSSKNIAVVLSGGNINIKYLKKLLEREAL